MNSSDNQVSTEARSCLQLRVRLTSPDIWWGSIWAVLCGVVASGAFRLDANSLVRLALVLLLADPLISNLSHLVLGLDWPAYTVTTVPIENKLKFIFPYTERGSSVYRMGQQLAEFVRWWRNDFWPRAGWMVSGAIFDVFCAVLVGVILGPQILWLVVGELGLIALSLFIRPYWPDGLIVLRAITETGMLWLVGFLTFTSWSAMALILACLYALLYGAGVLILLKGIERLTWIIPVTLAGLLGTTIAVRAPIIVGMLGVTIIFPVWLSYYVKNTSSCSRYYLRKIRLHMLIATFLAALAMGLT